MAVHAGEHPAVDRVLELSRIHVQAGDLAIDLVGEGGITVAGQAILVAGFWIRPRGSGCDPCTAQ